MSASKSKFFAYSSLALTIFLGLAPLSSVGAKTITIGTSASDIVEIPGLLVNTSLTGAGNRCLYVDGNNQLSVKGFDCGSSTGGDNLGDHAATQNLRLNSFWLSGDGDNEGIQIGSTGNLTTSGTVSFTGVVYAGGGNRMLTVDNAGVLGAASLPASLPAGTTSHTLRYNGSAWVSDGNLFNNGTNVGIGTTNPSAKLEVAGDVKSSVTGAAALFTAYNPGTNYPRALFKVGNSASDVNTGLMFAPEYTSTGATKPFSLEIYNNKLNADSSARMVGLGVYSTYASIHSLGPNGNSAGLPLIFSTQTYQGNNPAIYISNAATQNVGINTTSPGARLQVNGSTGVEALRLVTASDYSPLNIRNSGNTADIFRVDQAGSLAVGSVPWARLSTFPAACSAGQYVTAVGGSLTCSTPAAGADVYWTGTSTNLVASTARTSLGLGSLATLSSVANAQITDMAWSKLTGFPAACSAGQYVSAVGGTLTCSTPTDTNTDIYWTGTSTNLVASTARTSLGLGALATLGAVSGGTDGTITDGTITDADISASAAISASKIQNGAFFITSAGTNGQIWTSDGSGAGTWGTPNWLSGSGSVGMLAYWADTSGNLGETNIFYDRENIGISTTAPAAKLDVNGSLRSNSSVTFSLLGGGGTRSVTVDNAGNLGATALPASLPSGTVSQTLRNNGSGSWVANSYLYNSGSNVNVNYPYAEACNSAMTVNGSMRSTMVEIGPLSTSSCAAAMQLTSNQITFETANSITASASGLTFNNNLITSGAISANSGFRVGINVGISGTVIVKGSNGANCNLVFSGGILTSETCP